MRRREECFTTLQSGHLLHHSKVKKRLSHKQDMERSYSEGKEHLPQSSQICSVHNKTKRCKLKVVQVYAPTTSYTDEDIHIFYNGVDEILGNQTTTR